MTPRNQTPLIKSAPPTRTDDLIRELADDIINGRLLPGIRLDEQSLAKRFGVSRTPVREALRELASTGLVEKQPHKGVIVATISTDKLAEMFEVMAELEALCARFSALRMTPVERKRLEKLHDKSMSLINHGDPEDYAALNNEFHTAIYLGAHNEFLQELALATRTRLSPFRRAQFRMLGRMSNSFTEHDNVVRAILAGDGEGAAMAMIDHMWTVKDASSDYVNESAETRQADVLIGAAQKIGIELNG